MAWERGEKQAAGRRGGRAGLGWVHRWSLLEVLPFGFDAFSRWSFLLCLPGCLVPAQLALGFEGDFQSVPAWRRGPALSAAPRAGPQGGRTGVLPPLTKLRGKQGLY